MKFRENEEAVSPVIGVILMVAITVILAAIIAGW
jgi:flagellin-like protein